MIDLHARRRAAAHAEKYGRGIELLAEKLGTDRAVLADAINWAAMAYHGEQCWAETEYDKTAPDSLNELAKPLTEVIHLLYPRFASSSAPAHAVDRNFHRLVSALADPNRKAGWPRQLSEEAAWPEEVGEICGELDQLISRLESIRRLAGEVHIAAGQAESRKHGICVRLCTFSQTFGKAWGDGLPSIGCASAEHGNR